MVLLTPDTLIVHIQTVLLSITVSAKKQTLSKLEDEQ